jgi:hypothetical protein
MTYLAVGAKILRELPNKGQLAERAVKALLGTGEGLAYKAGSEFAPIMNRGQISGLGFLHTRNIAVENPFQLKVLSSNGTDALAHQVHHTPTTFSGTRFNFYFRPDIVMTKVVNEDSYGRLYMSGREVAAKLSHWVDEYRGTATIKSQWDGDVLSVLYPQEVRKLAAGDFSALAKNFYDDAKNSTVARQLVLSGPSGKTFKIMSEEGDFLSHLNRKDKLFTYSSQKVGGTAEVQMQSLGLKTERPVLADDLDSIVEGKIDLKDHTLARLVTEQQKTATQMKQIGDHIRSAEANLGEPIVPENLNLSPIGAHFRG